MKRMGVKKKNTFAGNMILEFMIIILWAIILEKSIKKYYKKEFCSVEKFIEEHFNIAPDIAEKLAEGKLFYERMFDIAQLKETLRKH